MEDQGQISRVGFRSTKFMAPSHNQPQWLHGEFSRRFNILKGILPKHELAIEGLFGALHYHWCYDTEHFNHKRNRVQLATVLLIITFVSTRPETIIKSGCDSIRGTNKAFLYKDIKIKVLQPDNHIIESFLIVKITLLFIKRRRHREVP